MKVVIPGGTGQVGTMLARAFHGGRPRGRRPQPPPGTGPVAGRRAGTPRRSATGRPNSTARTSSSTWPGGASTAGTPPPTGGSSWTPA